MKSSLRPLHGLAIAIVFATGLLACSKQDPQKIRELSQLEAEGGIDQDRKSARVMEQDLSSRFDFYEANSGHYEGWITDGASRYRIRISLFPNLPRYQGSRSRSQEEVQSDLTTLALNAQITQWNPQVPSASVGCRVENLRPDLVRGTLNVISSSCPSSYFLVLNRTAIAGTAQPSSHPTVFDLQAERVEQAGRAP